MSERSLQEREGFVRARQQEGGAPAGGDRQPAPQDWSAAGRTGFLGRTARHCPPAERRAMIGTGSARSAPRRAQLLGVSRSSLLLPAEGGIERGTRSAQAAGRALHREPDVRKPAPALASSANSEKLARAVDVTGGKSHDSLHRRKKLICIKCTIFCASYVSTWRVQVDSLPHSSGAHRSEARPAPSRSAQRTNFLIGAPQFAR